MMTTGHMLKLAVFCLTQINLLNVKASDCNSDLQQLGSSSVVIQYLQENSIAGDILLQLTTHNGLEYNNKSDSSGFIALNNGSLVTSMNITLDGPTNKDKCDKATGTGTIVVTVYCNNVTYRYNVDVFFLVNLTDDFTPRFTSYDVSAREDHPVGAPLLSLNDITVDEDCANIFYFSVDSVSAQLFDVVKTDSVYKLVLKQQLDYELQREYQVNLTVKSNVEGSAVGKENSTLLHVHVVDVDDMSPVFDVGQFVLHVLEDQTPPTNYLFTHPPIQARDGDVGINTTLFYTLEEVTPGLRLELNNMTGEVRILETLDRERTPSYTAVIKASQVDTTYKTSTASLLILVGDVNDNRPVFTSRENVSIMEDAPNGSQVVELFGTDIDEGTNALFDFTISNDSLGAFGIDVQPEINRTYLVVCNSTALRGSGQAHVQINLIERETANGGPACDYLTSCVGHVTVHIIDVNDHSPIFEQPNYMFNYSGNISGQVTIGQIKATDQDRGYNAKIVYSLTSLPSPADCSKLNLDPTTGTLNITQDLTGGVICSWIAYACDSPTDLALRRCSSVYMTATVLHSKDVGQQIVAVLENMPVGTIVAAMTVKDLITTSTDFEIRNDVMYTKVSLDREKQDKYVVRAISGSAAGSAAATSAVAVDIYVNVLDVNDNAPVFDHEVYVVYLSNDLQINQTFLHINASDKDTGNNSVFAFSLLTGQEYFNMDSVTGQIRLLNFPVINDTDYQLQVSDFGQPSLSSFATLRVYIPADNDTVYVILPVARDHIMADITGVTSKLYSILGFFVRILSIVSLDPIPDVSFRSKVYISAVSSTGQPVSATTLNELINLHAMKIFETFSKPEKVVDNKDDDGLSVLEIVLICVVIALLLTTLIATVLWCKTRQKYKLSLRLFDTLNRDTTIYDNPRKPSSGLDAIVNNNNESVKAQRLLAKLSNASVDHSSITNLIGSQEDGTSTRTGSIERRSPNYYENVVMSHMTNHAINNENSNTNGFISPELTNEERVTTFGSQVADNVTGSALEVQDNQDDSFPLDMGIDARLEDVWEGDHTPDTITSSNGESGLTTKTKIQDEDADENDEEVANILSEHTSKAFGHSSTNNVNTYSNLDLMTAPTEVQRDSDRIPATNYNVNESADTVSLSEPEPDYAKRVRFSEATVTMGNTESLDNVNAERNNNTDDFLSQQEDSGKSSQALPISGTLDDSIEELTAL